MTEPNVSTTTATCPSGDKPSLYWGRVPTIIGATVVVIYVLGFVVANAFYGHLWLVDPSLMQTRYAGAGLLWLGFFITTLVPAYYLLSFSREWSRKKSPDSATEQQQSAIVFLWITSLPSWLRWLTLPPLLLLLLLLFTPVLLLFVGPCLPLFFLIALGASPISVFWPVLAFYSATTVAVLLHLFLGMTDADSFDFRNNPHRILLLLVILLLHAALFGTSIYPAVPSGAGGAQPLSVRLTFRSDSSLRRLTTLGAAVQREGWLISSSAGSFLLLIAKPVASQSTVEQYCPVLVRSEDVSVVEVLGDNGWTSPDKLRNISTRLPFAATANACLH